MLKLTLTLKFQRIVERVNMQITVWSTVSIFNVKEDLKCYACGGKIKWNLKNNGTYLNNL